MLAIVTVFLFNACQLDTEEIEGEYYNKDDGNLYTLVLSNGVYTQRLIVGDDTIINRGTYDITNVVELDWWKEREDLLDSSRGSCVGCELKVKGNKLLYYIDPDSGPVEVFIKKY